jgi:hypothetical protein
VEENDGRRICIGWEVVTAPRSYDEPIKEAEVVTVIAMPDDEVVPAEDIAYKAEVVAKTMMP